MNAWQVSVFCALAKLLHFNSSKCRFHSWHKNDKLHSVRQITNYNTRERQSSDQ